MINDNSKLSSILISVLYFIMGVVFVAATDQLLKTFNYTLICICAVIGVIQFISFFIGKKYEDGHYTDLVMSVVFIWVSLILYVFDGFNILPVVFSLYLLIMAVDFLIQFVQKKDLKGIDRWKYFILFVISVVISLLLIFHTGTFMLDDGISIYFKITGIYMIGISLWYIYEFIKSHKKKEK